jgi:S-adenosylmethionine-diacylgycerolhomoserine-N-methlytransferase
VTAATASMHPMDRMYRHQRHIYDVTRKWYLLGRDEMMAGLSPHDGDRILEIGCGTGRNLVLAASRYPRARFYGIDVSAEMLDSAERAVARAGLTHQIALACVDATQSLTSLFGGAAYERIFISYALSMIPNWTAVIDAAVVALAEGGELHIVDFGGQERFPPQLRSALRTWLRFFDVTPCDRLEAALGERVVRLNGHLSVRRPYRGYAQHAVLRMPSASASFDSPRASH